MAVNEIQIDKKRFYEDTYRFTTRSLDQAIVYLGDVMRDLFAAGVEQSQITVRAELDAPPFNVEIEVYVTGRQAETLGWKIDGRRIVA